MLIAEKFFTGKDISLDDQVSLVISAYECRINNYVVQINDLIRRGHLEDEITHLEKNFIPENIYSILTNIRIKSWHHRFFDHQTHKGLLSKLNTLFSEASVKLITGSPTYGSILRFEAVCLDLAAMDKVNHG